MIIKQIISKIEIKVDKENMQNEQYWNINIREDQ